MNGGAWSIMQGGDDSGSNPNPNPKETSYLFDGLIRVSCLPYFQTLTLTLRKAPFLAKVCSYIFLLLSLRLPIFHCLLCILGHFSRNISWVSGNSFPVNCLLWTSVMLFVVCRFEVWIRVCLWAVYRVSTAGVEDDTLLRLVSQTFAVAA